MSKIAIISMGQLMNTTLDASVKAFAEASHHSETYVKAQAIYDELPFGRSYIQEYKTGHIGEAEFFDGLRDRLGRTAETLPDDAIRDAWNAMTGIHPDHEDNVRAIAAAVIRNDLHLVIASGTNPLHQQANLEALERVLGEQYAPFIESTTFALSHEVHTLDRATLATQGLAQVTAETGLDPQYTEIGSFHSGIRADAVKEAILEAQPGAHSAKLMAERLTIEQVPTTGDNLAEQLEHFAARNMSRQRG
jgi:hypothetical protein